MMSLKFEISALKSKILLTVFVLFIPLISLSGDEKGPLVSIELRDVELKDVLRALSQEHRINIIVDDSITGSVTVSMRNVPLWDAIESILRSKGYGLRVVRTNLFMVEPLSDYAKKQEDVIIKEFKLKYLRVSDKSVGDAIKEFKSDKGQVITMEQTNSIIVKDIPSVLEKVSTLLKDIDIRPAQITIEARIVEVSTNFTREFGINWSASYIGGEVTTNFAVNLPLPPTAGSLGLGYVKDRFRLDAQLTALESSGNAKIISSPKITVLENQEAVITSGTEILIPISNATTTGAVTTLTTSIERVPATLTLIVTPRSIAGQQVEMTINTTRDEFDRSLSSSSQATSLPPKQTRTARTRLIANNTETIVIGGIYSKKEFKGQTGFPFLSKIPLIGWLFKRQSRIQDQLELLIFITPTIIKEEKASELQSQ